MRSARDGSTPAPSEPPATVTLPGGLAGLPQARRFAFEQSDEIAPLLRMRCLDRPELSFLVVDPLLVDEGYRPSFPAPALSALGLAEGDPSLVLAIVCISAKPQECSANLLAPLLINPASLRGAQVILEGSPYSVRHPIAAADP